MAANAAVSAVANVVVNAAVTAVASVALAGATEVTSRHFFTPCHAAFSVDA